jgi:hypothetical protein
MGSESQIGSSHEDDVTMGPVMSHSGSSHESGSSHGRSSRWVQSVGPVSGSSHKKQVMRSTKSIAIVLQL